MNRSHCPDCETYTEPKCEAPYSRPVMLAVWFGLSAFCCAFWFMVWELV